METANMSMWCRAVCWRREGPGESSQIHSNFFFFKFAFFKIAHRQLLIYRRNLGKKLLLLLFYLFIYLLLLRLLLLQNIHKSTNMSYLNPLLDWRYTFIISRGGKDNNVCLNSRNLPKRLSFWQIPLP